MSLNLNVAYELLEVRNGESGLAPLMRLNDRMPQGDMQSVSTEIRAVLTKARGEDGQLKRENAERIAKLLAQSFGEKGSSTRNLRFFLETLTH